MPSRVILFNVGVCLLKTDDASVELKDCVDTLTSNIANHQIMIHEALGVLQEKFEKLTDIESDVAELKDSVLQLNVGIAFHDKKLDIHEKRLTSLEKDNGYERRGTSLGKDIGGKNSV